MNPEALFSIEALLRYQGNIQALLELDELISNACLPNAEQQTRIHHIIERALQS